jgi:hypothetical protein
MVTSQALTGRSDYAIAALVVVMAEVEDHHSMRLQD